MKRVKPIYIILCIILCLSFAVYFTVHDFKKTYQLHEEYDKLELNESINGVISEMYISKGASFITLENGKKVFLKSSFNYLTENEYLSKSLEIGDTLVKKVGSDTLFIKSEKTEYFILGKFIKENQN